MTQSEQPVLKKTTLLRFPWSVSHFKRAEEIIGAIRRAEGPCSFELDRVAVQLLRACRTVWSDRADSMTGGLVCQEKEKRKKEKAP